MKNPQTLRRGFTLVELLVVIVIILVLASLTFVVATRMKKSAAEATNMSNMRNLGMSVLARVSDEGRFFHRRNEERWDRWIIPSLGYTTEMPENRDALTTENAPGLESLAEMFHAPDDKAVPKDGAYKCSYGVAAWLSNANGYPFGLTTKDMGVRMARIRKPSKWFMMYQDYRDSNLLGKGFNAYTPPGTDVPSQNKIVVFVDGHAEKLPKSLGWSEFREKYEPSRND
ncbi:prepilin-type N-terminal cleavage/methylation domain-containing protein [Haloferula chungangensis]|uniref:Prepilin-type N-terminal cleavage/methylation domain-containing protein n=1 Tax=Haloferula chungangensis TaxID=1048331 RepID=A0ABW2LCE1_9BACT